MIDVIVTTDHTTISYESALNIEEPVKWISSY